MKILVTGSSGFIASQIITDLLNSGHEVVCCGRNQAYIQRIFPNASFVHCDFMRDKDPAIWVPRLKDIDVVINAVGILYHPNPKVTWQVHHDTPKALFEACVKAGVKRVIQISALGIDNVDVPYATSKLAAEKVLQSLPISSVILRPSLVYGKGSYGGTSLFRGLAALPGILATPGKGRQAFQPIYIKDLSKAISNLLQGGQDDKILLTAVGREKIAMKDLLGKLRSWLGIPKAIHVPVPMIFIKLASIFGSLIPYSAMNSTSYKMMQQDNIATEEQTQQFKDTIGFTPIGFSQGVYAEPSSVQDHWHAKLFFLKPALQFSLAFIWIYTAICTMFLYPKPASLNLLATVGIPTAWQSMVLYGAITLNALIGVGLLVQFKIRALCILQLLLIIIYTVCITLKLPQFWFEPFAPIAKNIPIMVTILVYLAIESDR